MFDNTMNNGERIEKAKQILREEADKEEYILFPHTINGIIFFSRTELLESITKLRNKKPGGKL